MIYHTDVGRETWGIKASQGITHVEEELVKCLPETGEQKDQSREGHDLCGPIWSGIESRVLTHRELLQGTMAAIRREHEHQHGFQMWRLELYPEPQPHTVEWKPLR